MSLETIGHSLPPKVEGQLRCFLLVSAGKLSWSIPNPPKDVKLQLAWWGENSRQYFIRPVVDNDPNIIGKSHERVIYYPVRCGPKQFSSYLNDMGQLHLNVVYGNKNTKFAEVRVHDISSLEPSSVLEKSYMLVCCTAPFHGRNVGKVVLSFSFQAVTETYNISSTIVPTTDQKYGMKGKPKKSKTKHKKVDRRSSEDVKIKKHSPHPSMEQYASINVPIPDRDMDISFIVGPGSKPSSDKQPDIKQQHDKPQQTDLQATKTHKYEKPEDAMLLGTTKNSKSENVDKREEVETLQEYNINRDTLKKKSSVKFTDQIEVFDILEQDEGKNKSESIPASGDTGSIVVDDGTAFAMVNQKEKIIDSLINKGNSLRDKMVLSAVEAQKERINQEIPRQNFVQRNSLLAELVNNQSGEDSLERKYYVSSESSIEQKAVELLLGKDESRNVVELLKKYELSESDEHDVSEDEDPLHDSSLLADLFYTTNIPETIDESSIIFSDNDNTKLSNRAKTSSNDKMIDEDSTNSNHAQHDNDSVEDDVSNEDSSFEHSVTEDKENLDRLSVDILTKLGRVKSFKLHMNHIELDGFNVQPIDRYFLQCKVPISVNESSRSVSAEILRIVSRKVSDNNTVLFERSTVFPIQFNEQMVNYWWCRCLEVVIFRKCTNEKIVKVGKAYVRLKNVLLSTNFTSHYQVAVFYESNVKCKGLLKLSISLTSSSERNIKGNHIIETTADLPPTSTVFHSPSKRSKSPISPLCEKHEVVVETEDRICEGKKNLSPIQSKVKPRLMYGLIMVSHGLNINLRKYPGNFYIAVRIFWSDEILKSKVCWDTNEPNFTFQQMIPVRLNDACIDRMKNNWLVIEIWSKQSNNPQDELVGMCRVDIHQLYSSLIDERLSQALLSSSYPIIAVDDYVRITRLQTTSEADGKLKVLLALGSHDQIAQLIQTKSLAQKSFQMLHEDEKNKRMKSRSTDWKSENNGFASDFIDHQMEIRLLSIDNIQLEDVKLFSESHVTYFFPHQLDDEKDSSMKMLSSTTNCCVLQQRIVFNKSNSFSYKLKSEVCLERVLQKTLQDSSNRDDIEFLLCSRDNQHLASGDLTLSKLFSNHLSHDGYDRYKVDLVNDGNERVGVLSLSVRYEKTLLQDISRAWKRSVCINLSLTNLCGLQNASRVVLDDTFPCDSGFAFYIKYFFTFHERFTGNSDIISNCFASNLSINEAIHLPIIYNDVSPKKSLAVLLEEGNLIVQLFCVSSHGSHKRLIGQAVAPSRYLLDHVTGCQSWFPIKAVASQNVAPDEIVIGGIKVHFQFAGESDREEVVNVGRGMGWRPNIQTDLSDENWGAVSDIKIGLTDECWFRLRIERITLSKRMFPKMFDGVINDSVYIYSRYKFFNLPAVHSKHSKVVIERSEIHCELSHEEFFSLPPTTSLAWYLREEMFEIQFWLCHEKNESEVYVGSCYLNLSEFSISPSIHATKINYYQIYKVGCNDIFNCRSRILISFNDKRRIADTTNQKNILSRHVTSDHRLMDEDSPQKTRAIRPLFDSSHVENSVNVVIRIEEALHVNKVLNRDIYIEPNLYVSYQIDTHVTTDVCLSTTKPIWNFQKEEKLDKNVLRSEKMDFKLWRCTGNEVDEVHDILVGIASVDTSPLFSGMQQLIGWYHIYDFNHHTVGQLKVGIFPKKVLSPSVASKYLKKISFLQPVNLEYTSFQSHHHHHKQTEDSPTSTTSKSMLLDQLKEKLNELDCFTKTLLQSPNRDTATSKSYAKLSNISENRIKQTSESHLSKEMVTVNDITSKTSSESFNDSTKNCNVSRDHSLRQNHPSVLSNDVKETEKDLFESAFTTDDVSPLPKNIQQHTFSLLDDSIDSNVVPISTHLLEINDDDNQSQTSSEINQSLASDDNRSKISDESDDNLNDVLKSNTVSEGRIMSVPESDRHSLLTNITPENLIDNQVKTLQSVSSDISDDLSEINETESLSDKDTEINDSVTCLRDNEEKHEIINEETFSLVDDVHVSPRDHEYIEDNQQTVDVIPRMDQSNLPNFFMKPQEMADSMKALRLAANFRYSPQSLSPRSIDSSVTTPSLRENIRPQQRRDMCQKNQALKERLRETLPADESEMERITNIFMSKS